MKTIRRAAMMLLLVAVLAVSVFAAQYISTIFTGKTVNSGGVTVTQTSSKAAIYHLYSTGTNDHTSKTFTGAGTKTVCPMSGNYGKSHYFQVEYGTYPSFSYKIN